MSPCPETAGPGGFSIPTYSSRLPCFLLVGNMVLGRGIRDMFLLRPRLLALGHRPRPDLAARLAPIAGNGPPPSRLESRRRTRSARRRGYNAFAYLALAIDYRDQRGLLNSFIPVATIAISWAFLGKRLGPGEAFESCSP